MRLQYQCSSCKKSNYFTPTEPTRGDLQMVVGEEVKVNCPDCGSIEKIHINKINAVIDNRLLVASLVLGIVLTILLMRFFGLIASFAMTIPIMAWVHESNSTNSFNKYMIRRK